MALRVGRPSAADLDRLLGRCKDDELTYEPTGGSLGGPVPVGLRRRQWHTDLQGDSSFSRAVAALEDWAVHRRAGLHVQTDGSLEIGTNVAMGAPLPLGYVEATCRIVAVIDEPDRFGFAYGTLPVHPERGEESFMVHRSSESSTRFTVEAVSRPAHPLARLVPPMAHRLQATATRRYLLAMRQATAG
jgi:uncharacterized protein (UPF0548 family)